MCAVSAVSQSLMLSELLAFLTCTGVPRATMCGCVTKGLGFLLGQAEPGMTVCCLMVCVALQGVQTLVTQATSLLLAGFAHVILTSYEPIDTTQSQPGRR